jgi:ligand-binding SRPBCC domain-containing protein
LINHIKEAAMYQLKSVQTIQTDLNTAWDFFSSPKNLQVITPDYMGFIIQGELPEKMYEGMFISYKVSPFLGIKLDWTTEITHIRELSFFVDEQRVGPYKIWHHEHHFKETSQGIEMTDIVSYLPPFGILGKLVQPVLIAPKLKEIFDFRYRKVEELFV